MRAILDERDFPLDELRLLASARSAGRRLSFRDTEYEVEDAATADLSGLDLALFSSGAAASRTLGPPIRRSRGHRDRQLLGLADGPRGAAGGGRGERRRTWTPSRRASWPTPTARPWWGCRCSRPLHDAAGLERLVVSTYQAVSGAGLAGVAELEAQLVKTVDGAAALTFDGNAVDYPAPATFPDVIAHNVLPMAGSPVGDGSGDTTEEQKFRDESRKILAIPGLEVTCTCVRVPVFTGHSLSIVAQFERPLSPDRGHRGPTGGARGGAVRRADTPARRRPGPLAGGPDAGGRRLRPTAGPVRQRRQPPQGRRPQRRPDRRGAVARGAVA